MEISFKDSFVPLFSQIPARSHEGGLPSRCARPNHFPLKVIEKPIPAVKGKEVSYKIRGNNMKPYLSCMNAVTKHMKDNFIIIPTTWASRRNLNTPSTSSQISKDSPINSQPNKRLNAMWVVPFPKNLLVTLQRWTILML